MRASTRHSQIDHPLHGAWPLLILYLAVFLLPPGGIPHHHHDHDLHTGDSCKKDACHIAIYHPGSNEGCDHKNHLTKAQEECAVCHFLAPRYVGPEASLAWIAQPEAVAVTFHYSAFPSLTFPAFHTDRGPPDFI